MITSARTLPPVRTVRPRTRNGPNGGTSRKRLRQRRFAATLTALALALLGTGASGVAGAAPVDDIEPPVASPAGNFDGVHFVQYDGVFVGHSSTGAFRVPYRITAPADPAHANGAVVVEAPHFATGLGALDFQMGRQFLLGRGFVHAGVGYSTTSLGPGRDRRILDPSVPGTFILGGFADGNGRTDDQIIADFALALVSDPTARALVGDVANTYVTGYSDAANAVLRLVESGQADGVFDLAFPFTAQGPFDPEAALADGRFNGRVVILNSASENPGNLVDDAANSGRYRFYAVAKTPHVSDPLVPFFSNRSTPASWLPALRAHFLQAHRWIRNGITPPPSSDVHHNVAGLPFVELGEATFHTGFLGSYDEVKSVAELGFATHRDYVKAFNIAVDEHRRVGSISSDEASEMKRRANLCPPLTYTQTYRDHYDQFVAITPC